MFERLLTQVRGFIDRVRPQYTQVAETRDHETCEEQRLRVLAELDRLPTGSPFLRADDGTPAPAVIVPVEPIAPVIVSAIPPPG